MAIVDDTGQINLRGNCRKRVFRYTDLPAFLMDATALEGKASDLRPQRALTWKRPCSRLRVAARPVRCSTAATR